MKVKLVMFAVCQFGFPQRWTLGEIWVLVVYVREDPGKLVGNRGESPCKRVDEWVTVCNWNSPVGTKRLCNVP